MSTGQPRDDASATVCVGQTCDDMSMASSLDVVVVGREHALVVSLAIFCKDSLCHWVKLVTIRLESLLNHTNATLGENTTLQRSVGLQTNNHLAVLINISSPIGVDALRQLGLSVVNTLLTLHLEHL